MRSFDTSGKGSFLTLETAAFAQGHYFPSKKGWIIGTFLWGFIGWLFYYTVFPFFDWQHLQEYCVAALIIGVFWVGILYFLGFTWRNTGYIIASGYIHFKVGMFRFEGIKIENIGSILRSYNLKGHLFYWAGPFSPALAIKGLMIHYWGGRVKVSPKDEKRFIEEIKRLNPSVIINL